MVVSRKNDIILLNFSKGCFNLLFHVVIMKICSSSINPNKQYLDLLSLVNVCLVIQNMFRLALSSVCQVFIYHLLNLSHIHFHV